MGEFIFNLFSVAFLHHSSDGFQEKSLRTTQVPFLWFVAGELLMFEPI